MTAYTKDDPLTIKNMFDYIAQHYDRANAILSFNLHKKWNQKLINEIAINNYGHHFLDLCSGTGDIALGYLSSIHTVQKAYLIDFSKNMLELAKIKLDKHHFSTCQINYIEADVLQIPLSNESIDNATMAYGIRNVKNPSQCIKEIYRILKPGGRIGILELTQPQQYILKFGHQIYLKTILPLLGKLITNNQSAYKYLKNSIQTFISPLELEKIMLKNGFIQTQRISLSGGIATILIGSKKK